MVSYYRFDTTNSMMMNKEQNTKKNIYMHILTIKVVDLPPILEHLDVQARENYKPVPRLGDITDTTIER